MPMQFKSKEKPSCNGVAATAAVVPSLPFWQDVSSEQWSDWHWQMKNSVRTVDHLNSILSTFTDHRAVSSPSVEHVSSEYFSFKVTPHMVLALQRALELGIPGSWESFHWSFAPSDLELARSEAEEGTDCIGEQLPGASPVTSITNFYRNRALFRVTTMCAAYCRYCFRRRMVGDGSGAWDEQNIREGLAYLAATPTVSEVILSGGDPLILSDNRLRTLIRALKAIPHIRRIRIDTKILTMMPQRVTDELATLLRENQPLYVIGHFTHLSELTIETRAACARLASAGVPLGAHTPLLRGVNDNEDGLGRLMEDLIDSRVQPYYLIQFIPTKWTGHFRVPIARGLDLIRHLHRCCGGLATPTYIVYLPDAGGKVPVSPQYILDHTDDGYLFETLEGRQVLYPESKAHME